VDDTYLAPQGERKEFFLKLENKIEKHEYSVHKMIDRKGNKAMFYRYNGPDFNIGDCILVKATVAEHRTYNGEPETYLNRVKVIQNVGSK